MWASWWPTCEAVGLKCYRVTRGVSTKFIFIQDFLPFRLQVYVYFTPSSACHLNECCLPKNAALTLLHDAKVAAFATKTSVPICVRQLLLKLVFFHVCKLLLLATLGGLYSSGRFVFLLLLQLLLRQFSLGQLLSVSVLGLGSSEIRLDLHVLRLLLLLLRLGRFCRLHLLLRLLWLDLFRCVLILFLCLFLIIIIVGLSCLALFVLVLANFSLDGILFALALLLCDHCRLDLFRPFGSVLIIVIVSLEVCEHILRGRDVDLARGVLKIDRRRLHRLCQRRKSLLVQVFVVLDLHIAPGRSGNILLLLLFLLSDEFACSLDLHGGLDHFLLLPSLVVSALTLGGLLWLLFFWLGGFIQVGTLNLLLCLLCEEVAK
mmetsp:Transcript_20496/g.36834  ORF Transcript_20496/g.36834 Transcript_20496/m.36834 type:complete len:375 (+) Transcript_20496:25-1149(+)